MKKICVIGNSHIGALIGASHTIMENEEVKNKSVSLDFFANAGQGIQLVKVKNGELKGVRYSTTKKNDIYLKDYDLFFICCDLYGPNFISQSKYELRNFSTQVREQATKDRIHHSHSMRLFREITAETSAPVYIASRPIRPAAHEISKDEFIDGINVISKLIQPAIYVEPPLSVLTETFTGNTDFFKNSSNMLGKPVSKEKHPNHDMDHMNENGGVEVLLHFLNKIQD